LIHQLEAYAQQQAALNQRQEGINERHERLREWQDAINLRQYLIAERQSHFNEEQSRLVQGLHERLMDAVRENELLAREIAELRLRLETMQGGEGE
jgi:hypothetical protein